MLQPLVSFTWETPRMSINLIESERRSQKSLGGTFVSIALHASLISLAVYATASAGEAPTPPTMRPDTVVFYPPQPEHSPRRHDAPSHPADPSPLSPPRGPVLQAPTAISDSLPPIDPSISTIPAESLFSTGGPGNDSHGTASPTTSDSGEPLFASQVDKPAAARDRNPIPRYPSLLESSRVEGTVLVQFVVDTLGLVDMSSFTVIESSNELFAQSLQATLPRWRFYPAEAGGRKVKQVVQLPLKFIAPHH
jgi:protein TonB